MIDAVALALELFEYKMDDLRHRRPVRGGVDSVWRLRRELTAMADRLDVDQARRFRELSRELGERETGPGSAAASARAAVVGFDDLVLGGASEREAPLLVGALTSGWGSADRPAADP